MTLALLSATDAGSRIIDWHTVDWSRVNRYVRRLQVRIVKAVKLGKWLMKLGVDTSFVSTHLTAGS